MFDRQMSVLRRLGYRSVPLTSLSGRFEPRSVVITFDDGYENFWSSALPSLKRHGYTSTVFVVANLIGKTNEWDAAKGDATEALMTLDQIRRAAKEGTDFGSHTLDHADLSVLPKEEAWRQIADSKAVLQQTLGIEVPTFCYPYGRKTPEVQAMVGRAGYRLACSTEKGLNTAATNPLALRRINIRSDTLMPVFLYKLIRGARVGR
jgi:peptidoglycan/xylan/chitin deacetylase (PgdA/CDA1 family)